MKIVITANGDSLSAPASPVFGRCPWYVFVDPDTMEVEAVENPAMAAAGGAGIQAAQFVVEQGARAVVTGNVGPNAFDVFRSAGVPVYIGQGGSVGQAVEAYRDNQLREVRSATGPAHAGMGRGGRRVDAVTRGIGRGTGRRVPQGAPPAPAAARSREQEIAELRNMAGELRKQLAQVMDRLDQLEEGG